ncbi:O-antigen ligase family protein [Flavobacterium sp. NRK F10]|uniref:O-antigen ligase family protein n=1 Tax=Flavobacterium sp. NRK F10 TaxID=2954931 RepID=UPI002090CB7B|nr:O-antigen ligase family protein [Flavobacterium sp. NRK F10]MCO6174798.1 O-antigen ligase family protein [Flavobacterium sp. NRK F10]
MTNIYSFLKNVWQDLIETQKENNFFIPFLLLLATIVLPLGINNITLGILFLFLLLNRKKVTFKRSFFLAIPILLFIWMALSYFWAIDKERTLKAIPKEITLLLIPFLFSFIPVFNQKTKEKILKYYSFSIVTFTLVFMMRALIRYAITGDSNAFFYHGEYHDDYGLVPKLLNAIHVSVYVAVAFFYFLTKEVKSKADYSIVLFLFLFILLLSSKNIIVVFLLLTFFYTSFYSKTVHRVRLRNIAIMVFAIGFILTFSRIKERFLVEIQSNTERGVRNDMTTIHTEQVHVVSIYEAWNNEKFSHGDFFPGAAFRVYQARMFFEFLQEEPIFWKGFGLNASLKKLLDKEKQYDLYPGYGTLNFHNQYIQNFAELGVIGFILLIVMLGVLLYKALQVKDFMHIAFTILMISLFLTESFLWRQRGVVFFTAFYSFFAVSNSRN